MKQRLLTFLAFALPCVVLFAVHYNALRSWFFMDDFAWLGLRMEYHTPRDLLTILFEPRAQGTVRALSERLFFLAFSSIFGMKAGPFHYWVFFTQCGSLVLANLIVRRMSGSALAGFAAATVWALTHSLAVALSWLSAYNEILCAFLMLLALHCLIRFSEQGQQKFWWGQWAAYLTSFLALEVTVVYPAVACVYVFLAARQYWKKVLWLWIPSLVFTAIHLLLIPKSTTPAYKMTFNLGIFAQLWKYVYKAVGPTDLAQFTDQPPADLGWWVSMGTLGLLTAFLAWQLKRRAWLPVMGVAWFVLFLGPILPLQGHFSDYYTTIASFGFAMLTGWAFQAAFNAGWAPRIVAIVAAGLFVWCEVVQTNLMEQWYRIHSGQMHVVLQGIQDISQRRKVDTILLAGIDDEVYISGMLDNPFRLFGIQHAYLLPGGEKLIRSVPRNEISMRTDQEMANKLMASENTVVAAFDGRGLVDVTAIYKAMASGQVRITTLRMDDKLWSARLGEGWYDVENGFRWMQRRATADLDTPTNRAARLTVNTFCPRTLLDPVGGKLELRAFVDGKPVGVRALAEGQQHLEFDALSKDIFEKKQVEITLEVSHVVVPPGDGRELGVAVFEIAFKAP